jgi:DUF4097 and DUF4098 domain-containing protein YvlB
MSRISIVTAAAMAAMLAGGAAEAQQRVDARHPASASSTVEIHVAGSLRVIGWNRNEVHVTGTMARPNDRIVIEGSGRSVTVRTRADRGRALPANLEIRVPGGASVEVTGGQGPVHVAGVAGSVEIVNQGGPVTVAGASRRVEITSAGGPVTVEGQTGSLEITSMGGAVRVSASVRERTEINSLGGPVDVTGAVNDIEVNSMGGGVRITSTSGRVEVTSVANNIEVRGSRLRGSIQSVSGNVLVISTAPLAGALSMDSHSGSVELRLPARAGATVNVTTFSGRFETDIAVETRRESRRERQVVVPGGGPTVSINTFSGSVKLGRS